MGGEQSKSNLGEGAPVARLRANRGRAGATGRAGAAARGRQYRSVWTFAEFAQWSVTEAQWSVTEAGMG